MRKTYRLGLSVGGTILQDISDKSLVLPENPDDQDLANAFEGYVVRDVPNEAIVNALNFDDIEVMFVDEYTDKEILLE